MFILDYVIRNNELVFFPTLGETKDSKQTQ